MEIDAVETKKLHGNFLEAEAEKPGKVYEGYSVDLAIEIARMSHFDFRFREVGDKKYGSEDDNGTWNGMIGELLRHVRCPPPVFLQPLLLHGCCQVHTCMMA